MRIEPLDPADTDALSAWHATYRAAHVVGLDYPTPWMLEEKRAHLLADPVGERTAGWAGYVAGAVVVTGLLSFPLMDNRHLAHLEVATDPAHRRRGHGSAMLEHLVDEARAEGRDTLTADAAWSFDAPLDGAGTPNAEFLRSHGFTLSLGDVKRVLDLPPDVARLERLAAESAAHHDGYALRHFAGAVPDDIVDGFGELVGSLTTEAPMGDLHLEAEVYDAARIRADEAVMAQAGRRKLTTVAVAPDGDLAAYSELVLPDHDPDRVYQWGTLVSPAHRGHRLGMAVKAHNLLALADEEPGRTVLLTYNAEVNTHMIAVNEALGFRPVERLGEFQRRL